MTLPALLANSEPLRTPESERQELNHYDSKVYKQCCQMQKAQSEEMKKLGVPFYCIREDLVVDDASESSTAAQGVTAGKITKAQLRNLKRQMNQHLEDMYKE
jgi:hypothetical protein